MLFYNLLYLAFQSIFPINNGGKTEGIKMTVAEYFGPNGTKIHKVGLEPDYKVESIPKPVLLNEPIPAL